MTVSSRAAWRWRDAKAKLGGKAGILSRSTFRRSACILARRRGLSMASGPSFPAPRSWNRLDGEGLKDKALQAAIDASPRPQHQDAIDGWNDDSALVGAPGGQERGDMKKLVVGGNGSEGMVFIKAMQEGGTATRSWRLCSPEAVGDEADQHGGEAVQQRKGAEHG